MGVDAYPKNYGKAGGSAAPRPAAGGYLSLGSPTAALRITFDDADLLRRLKELPTRVAASIRRRSLAAACRPMLAMARLLAPIRTTGTSKHGFAGRLQNAIYGKNVKGYAQGVSGYMIRVNPGKKTAEHTGREDQAGAYYASWVERGHRTPRGHGTVAPRPYLSKAFDLTVDRVLTNLKAEVLELVAKAAAKL